MSQLRPLSLRLTAILTVIAASTVVSRGAPSYPVDEISIEELEAAYTSGKATAHGVTQAFLDRIAKYDQKGPALGAIIMVNPHALDEADRLDAALKSTGKPIGPLHGVPVLIKDNYDVAGLQTTGGSAALLGWTPAKDSAAVAKLRAAGAIIVAKTTMSEWARGGYDNINSVLPGFARNPYNTAYATGGSSGGTGAGLAANFGVVGLGSDTWGSIRNPSSNNALVGIRPTVGLVSRAGMIGLYSARDTAGPMARNVTDLVKTLDVVVGVDPADEATRAAEGHIAKTYTAALKKDGAKGKRLGVLRQSFKPGASDPEVTALVDRAIADLRAQGAEIVDPFVIPEYDQFPPYSHPQSEVKAALNRYLTNVGPGFPHSLAEVVATKKYHALHEAGLKLAAEAPAPDTDPVVKKLELEEEKMRAAYLKAMDEAKIDALVLPVASYPPKLNGDRGTTPAGATTWIASGLHWPAVVVPMGYTHEDLPSGLQILGRPWSEMTLLEVAYGYEQATHHRHPPATTPPLEQSFAQKFIGTWKLVAIMDRDVKTGAETPAARGASTGQLIYAANGRLSVQIMKVDRPKIASGAIASATPEELKAVVDGVSSYYGTWELLKSEGCMVHVQDGNFTPNQIGQRAKRYYSFNEKGWLSLATPPRKMGEKEVSSVFVWEKLP